mgnify:CR=1 FL=1
MRGLALSAAPRLMTVGTILALPGPCQRRLPSDKNVVVTGFSKKGKDFTCGFFEPASGAIADDGVTHLAGHSEACAGRVFVITGSGLKD